MHGEARGWFAKIKEDDVYSNKIVPTIAVEVEFVKFQGSWKLPMKRFQFDHQPNRGSNSGL